MTSMALQLAQKYSAQTRCLYLNFEVFDGKVLTDDERNNDIWNANMCRGMSYLIFFSAAETGENSGQVTVAYSSHWNNRRDCCSGGLQGSV